MAGLTFDDRMPRVLSSKVHGVIDYIHAATNFAVGLYFWNRNRRAAAGAFMLGAGVLANSLCTDYELGVFRLYSFRVHGMLDYGTAGQSAALPVLLGFADEPEAKYFYAQGVVEAGTAAVSDYDDDSGATKHHPDRNNLRFVA